MRFNDKAALVKFARAIYTLGHRDGQEDMRERAAIYAEGDATALEQQRKVWEELPHLTPEEEWIDDMEYLAEVGRNDADAIRALPINPVKGEES